MSNTHSLDLEVSSSQHAKNTSPSGLPTTGDITMEVWVKPESYSSFGSVMSYGGTGEAEAENEQWIMLINASKNLMFFWEYGAGSNEQITTSSTYTNVGTWSHIAMVRDTTAKDVLFYVDGVLQETIGYTNNPTGGTGTVQVSLGSNPSNVVFHDGLVEEVRVWNDIRTLKEINDNMYRELNGDEAGLAGYWKLNNNYTDQTSNGNDLTASGSPVFSTDVPFVGFRPKTVTF